MGVCVGACPSISKGQFLENSDGHQGNHKQSEKTTHGMGESNLQMM